MIKMLIFLFGPYIRFLRSTGGISTHVRILPFGSAIGTYLVANFVCNGSWLFWRDWNAMLQAPGLGVIAYSSITASLEGFIMLGIMAAEYLRNKDKKSREKTARELFEMAITVDQRRMAEQWADEHGVNLDELRDAEGRRYLSRFSRRHRGGRRLRR